MSNQKTFKDLHSVIFSQESEDGATPCGSQAGPTTEQSGQGAHHVSRLATQESEKDKTISDTSGLCFSISSRSESLQSSLENRLRQRLEPAGSMIYKMTWKQKTTPRGRSYCQLVSSAHRTSDKESGLLLNGWITPASRDHKDTPGMATQATNPDGSTRNRVDQLPRQAAMAGWPTPTAQDHTRGKSTIRPQDTGIPLPQRVAMIDQSQPMRLKASGEILTGSSAEMESGGLLNARFSGFLMGYPTSWCVAAILAQRAIPSRKTKKQG